MSRAADVRSIRNLDELPDALRRGALSIGNFDGVHLGHARIIERLVDQAHRVGGAAVVFTFDPHPGQILRPDRAPAPLSSTERKVELLGRLGADSVISYPTDEAFLTLDAREFFERIVLDRLDARAIVEGPNFFFGHDRQGNLDMLAGLCSTSGVALEIVPPVELDGHIVSSSRVRELVASGSVRQAAAMLIEPHRIRGRVIHGSARGAGLGYPTANIQPEGILLPAEGIYAGRAMVDGDCHPAAISLGPNPTFDEGALKIEAFLIGFEGLLYDRIIELDFLTRLRDIVRFDSVDALVAQMDRDVQRTREIVENYGV